MKTVIGIDPGLSGAVCVLKFDEVLKGQTIVCLEDTPTKERIVGKRKLRDVDGYALAELLRPSILIASDVLAVIEDVHSMTYIDSHGERRGQGAASAFAFGKSFGMVIGVLSSFNIPMLFIPPAVWKLSLGLSSDKELSREKASKLFPSEIHRWPLKKHDGRCEALLLAWIGSRMK